MGMTAATVLAPADLDHILEHTRPLWEEVRGQHLFVTGGTGFFGCWLLESFAWANRQLKLDASATVLTRAPDVFQRKAPHLALDPAIRLKRGDMCDCAGLDLKASLVIHAAAEAWLPSGRADPVRVFDRNVLGTRQALELARRCKAGRFLFTSSGAVYGRQPPAISQVPEDYAGAPDPLSPASTYGQAKRVSEFLCAACGRDPGLETVIARCFAFVGPHLQLDAGYAIGNFIRDALCRGPIRVTGDGTPFRSYLYAADLAIWLWTILFRGKPGTAYNVGSDSALSILELAHEVRKVVAPQADVECASPQSPVASHQPAERYVPSIKRARAELGLEVLVPLPEAIKRTADWYGRMPVANRP
jgi:dTDP-glucose 4,6-dehydratase